MPAGSQPRISASSTCVIATRNFTKLFCKNIRSGPGLREHERARKRKLRQAAESQRWCAPSLRYIGGQAVQAELLLRLGRDDPGTWKRLLSRWTHHCLAGLAWAEGIPGLRTILREPIYFAHLWRGLREVDIAHIFSASYWSFLLAPTPAWLFARLRGKRALINYRSGEARDHLQRFRSGDVRAIAGGRNRCSLGLSGGRVPRVRAEGGGRPERGGSCAIPLS